MSFLCYAYIPEYRVLKGAELRFDPRWDIHFDPTRHTLFIRRQDPLPDGFWGPHIHSLTAIVGQNAAGKSSALRYILSALSSEFVPDGCEVHMPEGIFLLTSADVLYIYVSYPYEDITVELNGKKLSPRDFNGMPYTRYIPEPTLDDMRILLFRGHNYTIKNFRFWETTTYDEKVTNISDPALLISDIKSYQMRRAEGGNLKLREYTAAHIIQNALRIALLLLHKDDFVHPDRPESSKILSKLNFPKHIILENNRAGEDLMQSVGVQVHDGRRTKTLKYENLPGYKKFTDSRNRVLECFIESHFCNVLIENPMAYESIIYFWKGWKEWHCQYDDIIKDFRNYYLSCNNGETEPKWEELIIFLESLKRICKFDTAREFFFIDTDSKEDIRNLIDSFLCTDQLLTTRYFDLRYAHAIGDAVNGDTDLSSGELQILNLLSRIFDQCCIRPRKYSNLKFPNLIVLDEAETAFHPEWQRQYVGMLTDFLNILAENGSIHDEGRQLPPENVRFQIIYTTHSPTSLSDVPKCCVNFMQRDPQSGRSETSIEHDETFGANVFDLYRDSFFMHDGLVGSFATNKIKSLVKSIERLESTENTADTGHGRRRDKEVSDIRKHIALIGDPRIREYLTRLLEEKITPANREADLIREIERLRQENLELHNRLNIRDND